MGFTITDTERQYLRELAEKQLGYANLPVMDERKDLWYRHNALEGSRPPIVVEWNTFWGYIMPQLRCESEAAREIEFALNANVLAHEFIGDDTVVPAHFTVPWRIGIRQFGLDIRREHASDTNGRTLGYHDENPIKDLQRDLPMVKPSTFHVDREGTLAWMDFVGNVLGDILPVRLGNKSLEWHGAMSHHAVRLMGLEAMMFAMVDYPEEMHALYRFLTDDILAFAEWQEHEGLLVLNNGNDYVGSGSFGFTDELPTPAYHETGQVGLKDLWFNMNSQETVSISPAMFREFVYPYYRDLAERFGLVYYGCCEPVHTIWEDCISKLPGLRKVSISPWCDEDYMGDALRGGKVIYSRKPSPNFMGVAETFNEEAFAAHIAKTLEAAKGNTLEFIFRDVYTLCGDTGRPRRAVEIVRELIDRMW